MAGVRCWALFSLSLAGGAIAVGNRRCGGVDRDEVAAAGWGLTFACFVRDDERRLSTTAPATLSSESVLSSSPSLPSIISGWLSVDSVSVDGEMCILLLDGDRLLDADDD